MNQDSVSDFVLKALHDLMVSIPDGEIALRDDRLKTKWKAGIESLLISRFPVTQDLYYEIMKESPSAFTGGKKPVESISWKDAITFCNSLSLKTGLSACYTLCDGSPEILFDASADGYRLPTEAEWEFACRAGTTGIRYGNLNEIAWYKGNSENTTHEVGMKEPNKWGLYDMIGNVWEWCSDVYDEKVYGSYRIFRGGGWNDDERGCMATNRRRSHPYSFKIDDLGFRIARNTVTSKK